MDNRKTIFDLLLIFAQKKGIIIGVTLVVAIIAVVYSLLTPEIWSSRGTFRPDASSSMGMSVNVPGLSGIMSSLMGNASEDAQSALIYLRSRTLSEEVIRKFRLIEYFNINETDTLRAMDLALERLKSEVQSVGLNDENGLISVTVSTKDKVLSKEMADYYLERLDTYNRDLKLTKGKRNRQFLEIRVASARSDIDSLAIALRDFQKKNKAIDMTSQMSSIISLYSEVVSQKMIVDLELEVAKKNYPGDSPLIKELSHKRTVLSERIAGLEKSSDSVKPSYIMDIDMIPDLSLQYTQLMINLEIQKKVFEYIYPQFEAARIEEVRDMPTIEVIDYPRLAGQRTYPRRAMICLVSTFLGFLASLCLAYVVFQMEQNKETVRKIWEAVFGRKKGKQPKEK
jgi:tyrosine-protein kinase Etk/Wzc